MKKAIGITTLFAAVGSLIVHHGMILGWKDAAITWGGAALGSVFFTVTLMLVFE